MPSQGIFVLNQLFWVGAWRCGFPFAAVPALFAPLFYAISVAIMA